MEEFEMALNKLEQHYGMSLDTLTNKELLIVMYSLINEMQEEKNNDKSKD
jgi:hypothetical protein